MPAIGKRARGDISPPPVKRQKRQSAAKEVKYQESSEDDEPIVVTPKKPVKSPRRKTPAKASASEEGPKKKTPVKVKAEKESPKRKTPVKVTTKVEKTTAVNAKGVKTTEEVKVQAKEVNGSTVEKTVVKRKRKTAEEKQAESMPLAERTIGSKILVGAHVSAAGGAHNSVVNSVRIGGNAFALFLKSQRQWAFKPLSDEFQTLFLDSCKVHKYSHHHHKIAPIVPHGSYLVNLAHTDADRAKQAYDSFIDDLSRCHKMGIKLYNFHPGNGSGAADRKGALSHIAKQLNKSHKDASSGKVITLLETMAAFGGNTIGATFEELADIIDMIDDKSRVGVCLDTCHVFAAGYDLRSPQTYNKVMEDFDKTIGLKYLMAFHINDSKAPLNSGRDLHANIGTGFLGLRAFHNLVNDPRTWGIPMILETPIDSKGADGKTVEDHGIYAKEIKLLERLIGMDVDSPEFLKLEQELQTKGKTERERVQGQVDKKASKDSKKRK